MKVLIADIYDLYVHKSRDVKFPLIYKHYKIIWNMRDVLIEIWRGNITHLVIPELGTPGYDFPEFAQIMLEMGQIKKLPEFKYYKVEARNKI